MPKQTAVEWLLRSEEPAVRFLTRRDVLGQQGRKDAGKILGGPIMTTLLAGQLPNGGYGGSPYRKWVGTHWRLVSLVDLGVPRAEPRAVAAADHVLAWRARRRVEPPTIDGLTRVCASVDGNALATSSRLGLAADPRARALAESLIGWQWPDGGWNCHQKATGYRSSFHETLSTAWGLYEYAEATGDVDARKAADRAAELFLDHRLLYRVGTAEPINRVWHELRYPSYWHYDILRVLTILARMDRIRDPRASDALDELERRRRPDGRWNADGRWWSPPASGLNTPEV
ncbi:MAG TPA: hypothetical protein VE287_03780, partial [Actinopolymorphaceae bacterium]|nr:hypothetical protein [Actinopolymorphaceae bacterium]